MHGIWRKFIRSNLKDRPTAKHNAYYKNKIKKCQDRPSGKRLSGVPPITPIKTPNNIKKKKTQKLQNRPSEIRLSGVPPIMSIKTPNK